ncbi:hypothetical protein [Lacinutrix sp. Hel_I_90]|uniref:hypothetical protein n=1 Tax=Lacinutrix sp. Hel_I_90 TaxID=1249999 RepID=UPI0005C8D77A|nr:hypothetical protein [Lacinutrix sp. Hel_I_90]
MHKIEFIENKTVLHFPESALEFSSDQLIAFSKNLLLYQGEHIAYTQFCTSITYSFLNLVRTADLEKEENLPVIENVNTISRLVNGYFTTKTENRKETKVINMDFYVQKLPLIEIDGHKFYGPSDALFNTTYGEYLKLIHHFNAFASTADENELNNLIATIYRPEKENYKSVKTKIDYDGDRRRKYNPNLTPIYADILSALNYETKYAIFLFVSSCQNYIANCSSLDIGSGNTVDLSILFNSTSTETNNNSIGMLGTLYSLAETKVFGPIKEVAEQNTYDILVYLVNQTHEFNKLKTKSNATT